MAAGGQGEIYKLVGELIGTVKAIEKGIGEIKADIAASDVASSSSRANVHRRLDEVVTRQGYVESDMLGVKNRLDDVTDKIESVERVTVEVTTLRTKAEGAGTLGRWLIRIGIGIVTFAGWMIGIYTYWTGRPPP